MPATKAISRDSFLSALDFTRNCPISVSKAKNTEQVHAWDEALETEQNDMAPYGVYITNKVLQSVIGSLSSELARVERNHFWLEENPKATVDQINKRRDWIDSALDRAGQLKDIFDMVKHVQNEIFEDEGFNTVEMANNQDPDAWKPQQFVLFPYDEDRTRREAKARKLKASAIDERVQHDIVMHQRMAERLPEIDERNPTEDLYYRYTQKALATTSGYYDKCMEKKNEHFKLGKDGLSQDSETRAGYLELACRGIAKVLEDGYDLIPEDNVH